MMTIGQITELFGWMVLINIGLMILSVVLILAMKGFICKMHGKMFGLSEDKIAMAMYCYLGVYKIMIITFFLVPYIAMKIVGG